MHAGQGASKGKGKGQARPRVQRSGSYHAGSDRVHSQTQERRHHEKGAAGAAKGLAHKGQAEKRKGARQGAQPQVQGGSQHTQRNTWPEKRKEGARPQVQECGSRHTGEEGHIPQKTAKSQGQPWAAKTKGQEGVEGLGHKGVQAEAQPQVHRRWEHAQAEGGAE